MGVFTQVPVYEFPEPNKGAELRIPVSAMFPTLRVSVDFVSKRDFQFSQVEFKSKTFAYAGDGW